MARIFFLLFALGASAGGAQANDEPLYIFAAASLTDAINAAAEEFDRRTDGSSVGVYASSAALARQIQSGSPADVFVSANIAWMDLVEKNGFTVKNSRKVVARNALVIIGSMDRRQRLNIGTATILGELPADRKLMLGEPSSVPVGIYAAQALQSLGLYERLATNLIFGENTRAVLAWTERGETDLAIVYQTDALTSRKVQVINRIDGSSHTPIVYPAAVVKADQTERAESFIAFLLSNAGQSIFRRFGFLAPDVALDPSPETP